MEMQIPDIPPEVVPYFTSIAVSKVGILQAWGSADFGVMTLICLISEWIYRRHFGLRRNDMTDTVDIGLLVRIKDSVFRRQPTLLRKFTSLILESM